MIEIIEDWKDDLIWCPSQCYLKFRRSNREFVLYLRWRGGDPWQATLIECIPNGEFDMHNEPETLKHYGISDWVDLNVDFFADRDYEALKIHAIGKTKEYLNRNYGI